MLEKMEQNYNTNSGCRIVIGGWFTSMLTCLFIGLKLTRVINWSWIWVLSPLWITFLLSVIFVITLILIYVWAQW